jgi:DNA-binding GntR family transcriptional regulator
VFHALTLRLRMFISVLQLDYTPAVRRIVGDDRYILNALLSGNVDGALKVWRAKLDNAVRHMAYVSPTTFDPALWERLVGEA